MMTYKIMYTVIFDAVSTVTENHVIKWSLILAQYQRVTNERTNGQTDRRTLL